MSRKVKSNVAHSVFQRLLNQSKEDRVDFNLLLTRYGMERFIYRLSISAHSGDFILKGASLFLVWKGQNYRLPLHGPFTKTCKNNSSGRHLSENPNPRSKSVISRMLSQKFPNLSCRPSMRPILPMVLAIHGIHKTGGRHESCRQKAFHVTSA